MSPFLARVMICSHLKCTWLSISSVLFSIPRRTRAFAKQKAIQDNYSTPMLTLHEPVEVLEGQRLHVNLSFLFCGCFVVNISHNLKMRCKRSCAGCEFKFYLRLLRRVASRFVQNDCERSPSAAHWQQERERSVVSSFIGGGRSWKR